MSASTHRKGCVKCISPKACAACRFYSKENDEHGACRRFPPTLLQVIGPAGSQFNTSFPMVRKDFWCGEHRK